MGDLAARGCRMPLSAEDIETAGSALGGPSSRTEGIVGGRKRTPLQMTLQQGPRCASCGHSAAQRAALRRTPLGSGSGADAAASRRERDDLLPKYDRTVGQMERGTGR